MSVGLRTSSVLLANKRAERHVAGVSAEENSKPASDSNTHVVEQGINPLDLIQMHLQEVRKLGVKRVGIFGSFARKEAHDDSDVDVYVEFDDEQRTYDNFFALHELLETLFGRRVDLVTDKALTETKARLILPTVRYASYDS